MSLVVETKKRIYVAGPLYGSGHVDENVKAALLIAERLRERGFIPFVPHLFMFWHFRHEHPPSYWLEMDEVWLRCCHGMILRDGESPGAMKEVIWANGAHIPITHTASNLSDLDTAIDLLSGILEGRGVAANLTGGV
jgi:hypothetical protein